ncbi:MAG TPA: TonB-dependent receptor, partial [Candidatus Kapabacteria bacterium]
LLVLVATLATAQSEFGVRLQDIKTGEPIPGAIITYKDTIGKAVAKQFTNAKGETIRKSRLDLFTIDIRALGYRDTSLLVSEVKNAILLESLPLEQGEVVITAQRHASVSQDVPISMSVVKDAEIQSRAPREIDEVLRFIPGVTVTEDQVSIRGSSGYSRAVGSRVLYMMDGMPMLSADNGDIKFDAVPMINIQSIEVVKGAGSALYGSSALGGIINVITRKPSKSWLGAVNASAGSYQEPTYPQWNQPEVGRTYYNVEAGASNTFGDVGVLASGAYKRDEGYRMGDDTYNGSGFLKLTTPTSDKAELTFSTLYSYNEHGNWLYWKDLSNAYKPADSLSAMNERITSTKLNLYGAFKTLVGDAGYLDIKASSFITSYDTAPLNAQDSVDPHSSAVNNLVDAQSGYFLYNDWYLTQGITFGYQTVSSNVSGNHNGINLGLYAQSEYTFKPIIVTIGLRGDIYQYDTDGFVGSFSPKVGITWNTLIENVVMRSSFGTGFRAPTIIEKYTDQELNGFIIKPNPSLVPEKSYSVELGSQYQDKYLMLDGAVFYSKFDQLIEPGFVTDGLQTFIRFSNITDAEIFGHEEVIEFTPFASELLKLRLGYTYIYPHNITTNTILNFRPRHLLQSRIEMREWNFVASADFRYISQYESIDPILIQQVPDATARVNAYIFDARIGYSFKDMLSAPVTLTLLCQNILNYYYVEMVGNMAPPRSISLKLESVF